jgi:hypothetical protein
VATEPLTPAITLNDRTDIVSTALAGLDDFDVRRVVEQALFQWAMRSLYGLRWREVNLEDIHAAQDISYLTARPVAQQIASDLGRWRDTCVVKGERCINPDKRGL